MPTVVIFQKIDERTLYQKKSEALKKSNLGQMGKMGKSGKKSAQKDWAEGRMDKQHQDVWWSLKDAYYFMYTKNYS